MDSDRTDRVTKSGSVPVVGIGASAGGLEALRELVSGLPPDTGFAYVVVVHLAPERESYLAEILQRSAAIEIVQVQERIQIEANRMYVVPPGKQLSIIDGHIGVSDLNDARWRRAPINRLLSTLGQSHSDGIGVILSGGGSDGSGGLASLKENGGIVIAQDPAEAQYAAMPRSAIATGLVDFVLPVSEMAAKLVELSQSRPQVPLTVDLDAVHVILGHLLRHTGHDFSGYKEPTLMRRLLRRVRVTRTHDLPTYARLVEEDAQEIQALLRDLLISVTGFFRDPEAWNAVEQLVIPHLFDGKLDDDTVRIWVPGCATGEEAYSLAMLALEEASRLDVHPNIQVFASDVDEDALAVGREGFYAASVAADVGADRLDRFFTREQAGYRVREEVREHVLFAAHNLLRDPPFSRLDLVSCRNVLIYLKRDLQERVLEVFSYALRPAGYLVLGGSETADASPDLFRGLSKPQGVYQRRRGVDSAEPLPDLPLNLPSSSRERAAALVRHAIRSRPPADFDLHWRALERWGPPSVLVTENHDVLHLSDSVGRFLHHPSGAPSHQLFRLVPRELAFELRVALERAFSEGRSTSLPPQVLQIGGVARYVHTIVSPTDDDQTERLALVTFADTDVPADVSGVAAVDDPVVARLGAELEAARERLQAALEDNDATREEMKASNEELQSINEEYKSTLEELETSKEELQSVNEELHTVNQELHLKIEETSRANADLKNLIESADVGMVVLDRELRIDRFTPQVARVLNVMPRDRGRPFAHVTSRFVQPQWIAEAAKRVLASQVVEELELAVGEDETALVRVRPYIGDDDNNGGVSGVVVTVVDVSPLSRAKHALERSEERLRVLVDGVREYAILLLDDQGRVASWNSGAERLFQWTEPEILGRDSAVLYAEEDVAAGLPERDRVAAKEVGNLPDDRWLRRKDGTLFFGSGVLTLLAPDERGQPRYARVLRDNTETERQRRALEESEQRLRALADSLERRVQERTAELLERTHDVRRLASELVFAEQRERHLLAQVLHDDLQQLLYAVQMKIALLRRQAEDLPDATWRASLDDAIAMLQNAVAKTRRLSVDLSPPILRDEGLAEAVEWLTGQLAELYGLRVEVRSSLSVAMTREMRVLLYQIVRELLFNTVKHAEAKQARVDLDTVGDVVVIRVSDDGKGFDPAQLKPTESLGFGLPSLRERVRFFGGRLDIRAGKGQGTTVELTVPTHVRESDTDPGGAGEVV